MKTTQWEKMVAVANLDSRREDRDSSVFPIEVAGFDCYGRYFTERTVIVKADNTHCSFQVRVQVPHGSVVAICFIRQNSRPELFEVVHTEPVTNVCHVEASRLLPESVLSIRTPERSNRGKPTP
jgi:hypothetical protein